MSIMKPDVTFYSTTLYLGVDVSMISTHSWFTILPIRMQFSWIVHVKSCIVDSVWDCPHRRREWRHGHGRALMLANYTLTRLYDGDDVSDCIVVRYMSLPPNEIGRASCRERVWLLV